MSILDQNISYYNRVTDISNTLTVAISNLFVSIKNGKYKEEAERIRKIKDKEKQSAVKKKTLEGFTISGTFTERRDECLVEHSGMISIDIDNLSNAELERARIKCIGDPHSIAVFKSVSGAGLCVIFRMQKVGTAEEHVRVWQAIDLYMKEKYGILVDTSGKNVSRLRFVSYDPDIYINEHAKEFITPKTEQRGRPKAVQHIPTTDDDFGHVVQQVVSQRIWQFADHYNDWRNMAWALIEGLGKNGARDMFHAISSTSPKYDAANTDRYFDRFYNSYEPSLPGAVTRKAFFARAKEFGLSLQSPKTKKAITRTKISASASKTKHEAVRELVETEELTESEAISLADAVYNDNGKFHDESTPEETIEHVLSTFGKFEFNEIKRVVEVTNVDIDRAPLDDLLENDIWIYCRKAIPKKPPSDKIVRSIIHSSFSTPYNPIKEFIRSSDPKHKGKTDAIRAIANSIKTMDNDTERTYKYIKKWLVSTARMWDTGKHNPYMCILIGKQQGTGKTTFFRKIMPEHLSREYYAETSLSGSKDDKILSSQKGMILVDELAGLHKAEWDSIKQLLTQDDVTERPPYGRHAVKMPRIASWAGTSNQTELLRDDYNRRFLVLNVSDIDREAYNAVDKTTLFAQAYYLHLAGEDLNESLDEYNDLSDEAEKYRIVSLEETLIEEHFLHPEVAREIVDTDKLSPMYVKTSANVIEILKKITNFSHDLNERRISLALNKLDFPKIDGRKYGKSRRSYVIYEKVKEHY